MKKFIPLILTGIALPCLAQKPGTQPATQPVAPSVVSPTPTIQPTSPGAAVVRPGKANIAPGSITEAIQTSATFNTFRNALAAADLDATLGAAPLDLAVKGDYTVFAPTDEAFDKLPTGLMAKFMLPENKEQLRSLLLHHIISSRLMAGDLREGPLKTMNGEKVEVATAGKDITVGQAKLTAQDITATNGVIHTIGQVLIPESLKDFSPLEN